MRSTHAFVALAALAGLALAASLSASGASTRTPAVRAATTSLSITATGQISGFGGPTSAKFNLLGASAADTDSGKLTFTAPTNPLSRKTAEGLNYTPMQLTQTLRGKYGTLVIRSSVSLFDVVKEDDFVATGSWSVVRGTGKYAGLKGGGALVGITQFSAGASSISDYDFSYRFAGRVTKGA
jgi:hypothetical protein